MPRKSPASDHDFADDVARLGKDRRRQGYGRTITDPLVLDRIADVIQAALPVKRNRRTKVVR
jgi:hypothetical protein